MGKKRNKNSRGFFSTLLEEYRFELTVTFLFSLGLFLLMEDMEIKEFVWKGVRSFARFIADSLNSLLTSIVTAIRSVQNSDIVGIILIFTAGVLVINRIRIRTISRMVLPDDCPKCHAAFHRIHRTFWHRIIELFLVARVKHYRCKKCSNTAITATVKKKEKHTH